MINFFNLLDSYGVLLSSLKLSSEEKSTVLMHFDFMERAAVSLSVAQMFHGGHYFEFGSDGMATFRNFLTAFDLVDGGTRFPKTEFWAFDIFGDTVITDNDVDYFDHWRSPEEVDKYEIAQSYIAQHGLFVDKCNLVKGLFSETLSAGFKGEFLKTGEIIGFAFLDCNITKSYEQVFYFLDDMMGDCSFIYMDEFHFNKDVPILFELFCKRNNFLAYHVRSAGAFGALFKINKNESEF